MLYFLISVRIFLVFGITSDFLYYLGDFGYYETPSYLLSFFFFSKQVIPHWSVEWELYVGCRFSFPFGPMDTTWKKWITDSQCLIADGLGERLVPCSTLLALSGKSGTLTCHLFISRWRRISLLLGHTAGHHWGKYTS